MVRSLFRAEAPSAERLVESAEQLAVEGMIPIGLARMLREDYEDAQLARPDDPPLPFYYKR